MEHLLLRSKCSIFHNIQKNLTFQRRPKALVWSKGLNLFENSIVSKDCSNQFKDGTSHFENFVLKINEVVVM